MIAQDVFEPQEIYQLMLQSVDVVRDSYNAMGLPDYSWIAIDGHRTGVSRKQVGELLGSLDEVELQLRKEMVSVDEMYLLNEGVFSGATLHGKPGTQIWYPSKDGRFLLQGHKFGTNLNMFYAWIYQLDKCGITYFPTFDWEETATALVAMYKNSQNPEHTTLRRYIKTKIYPPPFNPQVETLMGVKGVDLGEKKAKALIKRYGTIWLILNQEPEELAKTEDIGIITAKRLLKAIGRRVE